LGRRTKRSMMKDAAIMAPESAKMARGHVAMVRIYRRPYMNGPNMEALQTEGNGVSKR
jgi:hypothetical protein